MSAGLSRCSFMKSSACAERSRHLLDRLEKHEVGPRYVGSTVLASTTPR
jgi:hypothetical protein